MLKCPWCWLHNQLCEIPADRYNEHILQCIFVPQIQKDHILRVGYYGTA